MRYNRLKDLVAGVAGGPLSVNRAQVGIGGGPKPLNDHAFLANGLVDGVWGLVQLDRDTGWVPHIIDPKGATRIGAGGDNWAATVQSQPPVTYGVIAGVPFEENPAERYVLDGALDGGLLFLLVTPDGATFYARWPDGVVDEWLINSGTNLENVRMAAGAFVYQENSLLYLQLRGAGRRQVPTVDTPFEPMTWEDSHGFRWFLYHNDATYIQYGYTATGYQFGGSYAPDMWIGPTDAAQVALTLSPGEAPSTIQLVDIQLGTGVMPISRPIVYPPVVPFARRFYLAPFKDLRGVSGSNSEVVIDGAAQQAVRPCWVGQDLDGGWTSVDRANSLGRLIGICAESRGDLSGYAHVRAKADQLKTRVAWWKDGPDPLAPPSDLHDWDELWAEWYVFKEHGETLAIALDRWKRELDLALASKCQNLAGIPQYFTRGIFSDQETVDIIGAALDFFRNATPRLVILAPFEYDRANGITGNVACAEMYRRTLAACVLGRPSLTPAWPDPPPPVHSTDLLLYEMIRASRSAP